MDGNIRAVEFPFAIEAQAHGHLEHTVDERAAGQRERDRSQGSDDLCDQRYPSGAAEGTQAEDACRDAPPRPGPDHTRM